MKKEIDPEKNSMSKECDFFVGDREKCSEKSKFGYNKESYRIHHGLR